MVSLDNFLSTPIAHRGLYDDNYEENSLSAFRLAVENGFGIETDVHILKDGVVAVFHDANMKRICGVNLKIESLTSDELKKYPMTVGGEVIPTLPELLKLIDGRVPLLIELKCLTGFYTNKLAKAVLRDLAGYKNKSNIALQSFDPFAVRWIRKNQTDYPFGQLASMGDPKKNPKPNFLARFMGELKCCKISKPQFISYDILNTPNKFIQSYIDKGMPVFSWTVNTNEKLAVAKKYTSNIIFEKIRPIK
ncbi:MAG: glycerophosphodiester phosphodiesterase family protein [Clostridia bacterium]